jgi:hypothetical protein
VIYCFQLSAFKFNLRRYTEAEAVKKREVEVLSITEARERQGLTLVHFSAQPEPSLT